jgi:hypothetical protein
MTTEASLVARRIWAFLLRALIFDGTSAIVPHTRVERTMEMRKGNDFIMAESNKILSVLPVTSSFCNRIFSASFFFDSNVRDLVQSGVRLKPCLGQRDENNLL